MQVLSIGEHMTFVQSVLIQPRGTTTPGDSFNALCKSALIKDRDMQASIVQGRMSGGRVIHRTGSVKTHKSDRRMG